VSISAPETISTKEDLIQAIKAKDIKPNSLREVIESFKNSTYYQIYFERIPSTVDWNTLKMGFKLLVEKENSGIRIEWSDIFEQNHKRQLRKNELNAKQKRSRAKESQRKIDQQDFYNHPLFEIQD
jgi:hypothetical protein